MAVLRKSWEDVQEGEIHFACPELKDINKIWHGKCMSGSGPGEISPGYRN